MKVVINACFGGFGLSAQAENLYAELAGFKLYRYEQTKREYCDGCDLFEKIADDANPKWIGFTFKKDHGDSFEVFPDSSCSENDDYWYSRDIKRDDPLLVQVVESLGGHANGSHASLKVVEIPDGTDYVISEYDGNEHIAENHQTWY